MFNFARTFKGSRGYTRFRMIVSDGTGCVLDCRKERQRRDLTELHKYFSIFLEIGHRLRMKNV